MESDKHEQGGEGEELSGGKGGFAGQFRGYLEVGGRVNDRHRRRGLEARGDVGAEERQCAGLWREIAGKLLEGEAFGPFSQLSGDWSTKPIAFAIEQTLRS